MTPTDEIGVRIANDCQTLRYRPLRLISSMTTQSAARRVSSRSRVTAPMIRIASPGPGKRLAEHHVLREPEREPDVANLVLEEIAQWLDELEPEVLRQSADVVMGLDLGRVVGVVRRRLDDVGVERPLGEEIDRSQSSRLLLEDADERRADAAAFLLGVDHAGERVEELVGGVDVDEVDVALGAHHVDDPIALASTEQAVVDEDAGQLIADRAMHQRRSDRRVHAAAERADHLPIADLVTQRGDRSSR